MFYFDVLRFIVRSVELYQQTVLWAQLPQYPHIAAQSCVSGVDFNSSLEGDLTKLDSS